MAIDLRASLRDLTYDWKSGRQILSLELQSDFRPYYDQYKEKVLLIKVGEYRKRRSLDANALFWATVGDISAVIRVPPAEIYQTMIRDVGGNYEVLPVKTEHVSKWIEIWRARGLGWPCDEIGASKIPGYTNVISYYGSSTYDAAQMSRLIDIALQEARRQGIPPRMTAREISLTLERWGSV